MSDAVNFDTIKKGMSNLDFINSLEEVTLEDTVDLMKSNDYVERFIAEYIQLVIRHNKLRKMLIQYKAKTLQFEPKCDLYLLEEQLSYMREYLYTLEVRAEVEGIILPKK